MGTPFALPLGLSAWGAIETTLAAVDVVAARAALTSSGMVSATVTPSSAWSTTSRRRSCRGSTTVTRTRMG